ncbi:MAG: hypothetical protein Kow00108_19660 [Calditrichia bacterium]
MRQNGIYKITYIEDDSNTRMFVKAILTKKLPVPVEWTEFDNGTSFLEAIRHDFDVDLLITGVGLPGVSIYEFLPEFVQMYPEVPVIFLTGNYVPTEKRQDSETDGIIKSLPDNFGDKFGIKRYKMIPKPFEVEPFVREVQKFL